MNACMDHKLLKCDWGRYCLYFSNAADGWWQEQEWLFGHCPAYVKSTLWKIFISPRCWWESVNTCWRDSNFCGKCHAWNNARMLQGQISLVPYDVHLSPMLGLHCDRHHLFLPSHSEWHPPIDKQFRVNAHVSLNLPAKTCNTLEHF